MSINVAGGAGSFETKDNTGAYDNTFAFGAEGRVRLGVGANSEIGLGVFGGGGTPVGNGDPPFAIGGKLTYKLAPFPWLAFVVDAGAMNFRVAAIADFSGDLAVIVAPWHRPDGRQLYVALKGTFAVPVLEGSSNVNEALIVPIGLDASPRASAYVSSSKRVRSQGLRNAA